MFVGLLMFAAGLSYVYSGPVEDEWNDVLGSCRNPSGNRKGFNDLDDLRQQILDTHNYYRCLHGVPFLKLVSKLNSFAQAVADDNALKGKLEHSGGPYGENLYAAYGKRMTGKVPTKSWYDEIEDYDFNDPGYTKGTGHFTQVVWKNSKRLGCGYAKASSGWEYVACSYDPPGNYNGANNYRKNVPPPI